jgi:hypothetical protein
MLKRLFQISNNRQLNHKRLITDDANSRKSKTFVTRFKNKSET